MKTEKATVNPRSRFDTSSGYSGDAEYAASRVPTPPSCRVHSLSVTRADMPHPIIPSPPVPPPEGLKAGGTTNLHPLRSRHYPELRLP